MSDLCPYYGNQFCNAVDLKARAEKAEAEVQRLRKALNEAMEIMRDDSNPCECSDCIDVHDRQVKFLDTYWNETEARNNGA